MSKEIANIEKQVNKQLSTLVAEDIRVACKSIETKKYIFDLTNTWRLKTNLIHEKSVGKNVIGYECKSKTEAESLAEKDANNISESSKWHDELYTKITAIKKPDLLLSSNVKLGLAPHVYSAVEKCDTCDGRTRHTCHDCSGQMEVDCSTCNGHGRIHCRRCNGGGQVPFYFETTCTSCSNSNDFCMVCNGTRKVTDFDYTYCGRCSGSGIEECSNSRCRNGKVICSSCTGEGIVDCRPCEQMGCFTYTYGMEVSAIGNPNRSLNIPASDCAPPSHTRTVLNGLETSVPLNDVQEIETSSIDYSDQGKYPVVMSATGYVNEVQAELVCDTGHSATGWFYGSNLLPLCFGNIGEGRAQLLLSEMDSSSLESQQECLSLPLYQSLLKYRHKDKGMSSDPLLKQKLVPEETLYNLLKKYNDIVVSLVGKRDVLTTSNWVKASAVWLVILYVSLIMIGSFQPIVYQDNYGMSFLEWWVGSLGWKFEVYINDPSVLFSWLVPGIALYIFINVFLISPKNRSWIKGAFHIFVCTLIAEGVFGYLGFFALLHGGVLTTVKFIHMWSIQNIHPVMALRYLPDMIAVAVILGYLHGYKKHEKRWDKRLQTISNKELREDLAHR